MNEKRKIIFREAAFTVPFLIIAAAATFVMMFTAGRSPYDIQKLITTNYQSDSSMSADTYKTTGSKSYTVKYYYGDDNECVCYAEYVYNAKGDAPEASLTLFETRGGFDPGVYETKWFLGEEYVTYRPLESSEDDISEKYLTEEVPVMYGLIKTYSWEGAMESCGCENAAGGYSLLGLKLFAWDNSDSGVARRSFVWGFGGRPLELYSYIQGSQGEYKKIVLDS